MSSTAEQLRDLAALLDQGLITRAEFDEQKTLVLQQSRQRSSEVVAPSHPEMPASIGSYVLLGPIGAGGMGAVFRARHRVEAMAADQGGEVAIKVLHGRLAANATYRERFEREAALGRKLDHPGIVRVFDLITDGTTLGLVMQLARGIALSKMIGQKTGPIPWPKAQPLFVQLLDAVGYAHSHGVIHRDLKPDNIVVDEAGHLAVLDFGIAREIGASATLTGTGTGMGTAAYMAPEQYLDARHVDHRADLYALGMTLYEMVAGQLPWPPGIGEFTILQDKAQGNLPAPTAFYPHIPAHVVAAIQRATRVETDERFASTAEFLAALRPPAPQKPVVQATAPREPEVRVGVPCPCCGAASGSGDRFCLRCGAVVWTGAAAVAPRICVVCGQRLHVGDAFCFTCGNAVERTEAPARSMPCQRCGQRLLPDSRSCTRCGTMRETP